MFCLKCPGTPALREPWSDSPLPDNSLNVQDDAFCRGCGYSFGKDHRSKSMWRCLKCNDYFVCTNCKLCKNNHHLIKRYNLKNHGSAGSYKENSYSCDCCSSYVTLKPAAKLENPTEAQKFDAFLAEHNGKTGNTFVWHCLGCKYDICPKHFTNPKLGIYKAPNPQVTAAAEKAATASDAKGPKTTLSTSVTITKKKPEMPGTLFAPSPYDQIGSYYSSYGYPQPAGSSVVSGNAGLKVPPPVSLESYMSALNKYPSSGSGLFGAMPKPPNVESGTQPFWPSLKNPLFGQQPVEQMQKMFEKFKPSYGPPITNPGLFPPKVVGSQFW